MNLKAASVALLGCGLFALAAVSPARGDVQASDYTVILERDPFQLKPQPVILPKETNTVNTNINLTALISMHGVKMAYLAVREQKGLTALKGLKEGEKDNGITVVKIDIPKKLAVIKAAGDDRERTLTLEKDGIAPVYSGIPATQGIPGVITPGSNVPGRTGINPAYPSTTTFNGAVNGNGTVSAQFNRGATAPSSIPARPSRIGSSAPPPPNQPARALSPQEAEILMDRHRAVPSDDAPPPPPRVD